MVLLRAGQLPVRTDTYQSPEVLCPEYAGFIFIFLTVAAEGGIRRDRKRLLCVRRGSTGQHTSMPQERGQQTKREFPRVRIHKSGSLWAALAVLHLPLLPGFCAKLIQAELVQAGERKTICPFFKIAS